jgi:peptidoglycan/LPS O-acetylase OafA/YrhL
MAILLVLASHGHIPGFKNGGGVGVGLFFALSGFLITSLLVEELHATGRVDFRRFYERRARRLLPALLALVAAVSAGRVILGPWFLDWTTIPVVLLYGANWLPAYGIDPLALGHTWTLGIEEQFYIAWPLVVALLVRRSRILWAAAALATASFFARLWMLSDGVSIFRVLNGTDTVAVVLLSGAVVALLRLGGGADKSRPAAAVAALVAVAGCLLLPDGVMGVLGQPMIGLASAVLLWAVTGGGAPRLLEARWLRWFGSRSYGMYLWHAPFMWALVYRWDVAPLVVALVGIPFAVIMAEVSYRWIESPFRARQSVLRPPGLRDRRDVTMPTSSPARP